MHDGTVSGKFNNTGEKKAVGKQAFFFPCHYKIVSEETTTIFFFPFFSLQNISVEAYREKQVVYVK